MSMSCPCHVYVMSYPCHVYVMSKSCPCHVHVCPYHVNVMSMSCQCHDDVMSILMSCSCHVTAMFMSSCAEANLHRCWFCVHRYSFATTGGPPSLIQHVTKILCSKIFPLLLTDQLFWGICTSNTIWKVIYLLFVVQRSQDWLYR